MRSGSWIRWCIRGGAGPPSRLQALEGGAESGGTSPLCRGWVVGIAAGRGRIAQRPEFSWGRLRYQAGLLPDWTQTGIASVCGQIAAEAVSELAFREGVAEELNKGCHLGAGKPP